MGHVKLQKMLLEIMCTLVECSCLRCLFYINLYLCDPYSDFSESVEKNVTSADPTVYLFLYFTCAWTHACVDKCNILDKQDAHSKNT